MQVGDRVEAGQVLGEMDPVDLDERVQSQGATLRRVDAAVREAEARQAYAQTQAQRYERLLAMRATSEELVTTKPQEQQIADAALAGARQDRSPANADREALLAQRSNLLLIAPVSRARHAAGGRSRHDRRRRRGVIRADRPRDSVDQRAFRPGQRNRHARGLPAHIVPAFARRSGAERRVLRVEPRADAITEETLAKVTFDTSPDPLPPVGELAEVTVDLPALPAAPLIPNAAIRRDGDQTGVWQIIDGDPRFTPVQLGASDLDGFVQVRAGLAAGDQVVVYSEKALTARSRVSVVERIPGVPH